MAGSIGDITRRTPQISTDKFLKSLKSADKSYRITDAGCKGLMIGVTAAGGRNWIYRYTFNNKPINMALKASYPALSLADA
ncbi:Arm DNA-binding domain-containing protein [Thiomicrorhabdus aquaedulcis]|uniref:Arm DNA-binding domain-containing protein n=1 Tax=Thiomicrorhabdus aquaedulcis TaxID=2211106 RepID=UPI000FD79287|nr:Arm DNA-binding domain-containing protein [Thiomicrorhabdus aquaedulcis]